MVIPSKFKLILEKDQALQAEILSIVSAFQPILKDRLFFFEEYTDHGIEHIEKVLKAAEFLIPEESFQWIKPQEIAIIILSTLLHDIGMHTEFATFKALLEGQYDDAKVNVIDKKTWSELWEDYLSEVKHFSSNQKEQIWGNPNQVFKVPNLFHIDNLDGADKKLIGEFIRKFHPRLAHEISVKGFIGHNGIVTFGTGSTILPIFYKQLAGIVARSHGINVRDTFKYLENIAYNSWKNPNDINVVFLMILLRIADYIQIDNTRTEPNLLKIKTLSSPLSQQEHQSHLDIVSLNFKNEDPELIRVLCEPKNAQMYVKLENLFNDIQKELDLSWAILGEIYGFYPKEKPQIKFRRISSNLHHPNFLKKIEYIPQKISFKVNSELSKLLVAPLYGDDPKYGVRELVQNATDACKERLKIEQDEGNNYTPLINVSIDKLENDNYLFKIVDNGKGMSLEEIVNYFLYVGASFRKSFEWKKEFISKDGEVLINRNGRFGVGILAAFLLGDEIEVKTTSRDGISYLFKSRIDSPFIEIRKVSRVEVGTEIVILMNPERYNKLEPTIQQKFNAWVAKENKDSVKWNNWYIEDFPQITYTINNKKIKQETKSDLIKDCICRNLEVEDFGKITWFYKSIGANRNIIICNGIFVTKQSRYNSFQSYSNFNIVKSVPNLIIEDPHGIFPLKLDRNDVDCLKLPFEDDLICDISKQIIAHILTLSITQRRLYLNYQYNARILYSKKGYSIDVDYFVNRIRTKYRLVRIITRSNKISHDLFVDNCMIRFDINKEIKLSKQEENVAPKQGGIILLKKEAYYKLFKDSKTRRLNKRIKGSHKKCWEDDKYVIYRLYEYGLTATPLYLKGEFIKKLRENNMAIESIQEIPFNTYSSKRSGEILNELFEFYFGNNVVIPYNIEDRVRMFPKAFEELKDYMKDYVNFEALDDLLKSTE